MGMYTQIRGWFCLDSIGDGRETQDAAQILLDQAITAFRSDERVNRDFIASDLTLARGCNGTLWLFVGTEFKNYDDDVDLMVEHLRKVFPGIEGRLDIQYEEEEPVDPDIPEQYSNGNQTKTWKINKHGVQKLQDKCWCYGYGLDYKRDVLQLPRVVAGN